MNRFDLIIQELKEKTDESSGDALRPKKVTKPVRGKAGEHRFRLPYSSNPKPIEEQWKKS
jgi:hypothetical protein